MKQKSQGFIAISLIYSFFLVFLMTISAIIVDYAHNRILVNEVLKDTQNYLNSLAENDQTKLPRKDYTLRENVNYAGLTWQVIGTNGNDVTLVLNRALNNAEITAAINHMHYELTHNNEYVKMCSNIYTTYYCFYTSNTSYKAYNYDNSLIKALVNAWFDTNSSLQEALTHYSLTAMTVAVNGTSSSDYVRIMNRDEASIIGDNNTWTYTYSRLASGISYTKNASNADVSTVAEQTVRPVITVKKN